MGTEDGAGRADGPRLCVMSSQQANDMGVSSCDTCFEELSRKNQNLEHERKRGGRETRVLPYFLPRTLHGATRKERMVHLTPTGRPDRLQPYWSSREEDVKNFPACVLGPLHHQQLVFLICGPPRTYFSPDWNTPRRLPRDERARLATG